MTLRHMLVTSGSIRRIRMGLGTKSEMKGRERM